MNRRAILRAVLGLAALPFVPLRAKGEQATYKGVPVTMRTLDCAEDYQALWDEMEASLDGSLGAVPANVHPEGSYRIVNAAVERMFARHEWRFTAGPIARRRSR